MFSSVERGFILLGNDPQELVPKATRHRRGESDSAVPQVSRTLCAEALRRRELLVFSLDNNTDFDQGMSLFHLGIRHAMAVPLLVKDEVLGLLVMDSSSNMQGFNEHDMALAAAVARQIAIALKTRSEISSQTEQRRNLMRFLPKPVVDQAVEGKLDLELGGQSYDGLVLFADIVGFTFD